MVWDMEGNEVSLHEVQVLHTLKQHEGEWMTNTEIAEQTEGVAPRTVRATTLKLVRAGILDQAEVFPAHRFRLSAMADKRNRGYFDRLTHAADVFGIAL